MRAYGSSDGRWPPLVTALVIFVVLIGIVQIASRAGNQPDALQHQFAASPPAPNAGQIVLPPVPTNLVALARTTTARVLGGLASAPINRVGRNQVMQVEISRIEPVADGLKLAGNVTNIGTAPLPVSLDSFKFTDATGTVYASTGSPATQLEPQQSVPLDITLPIVNATSLTLAVEQPGQPVINLVLLQAAPTPTP